MYTLQLTKNLKLNSVGEIIERQKQVFPPEWLGSRRDYHALTRGLIVNEVSISYSLHRLSDTAGEE